MCFMTMNSIGTKRWMINGYYHRVDGPAVEYANGHKEWWLNGRRHREDGPAIEYADGYKEWFVNGLLVRNSELPSLKVNWQQEGF